ncbi:unnamed protein product [Pleuronectes platessa]|uniref:Uncharacterized protein n=1 Tax=Pleuronectes platessa TaxID=8262 RepID=A0A9N7VQE3_PLEPL|nr:unnamed protein product [Pleuronectes platessa]
MPKILKTTSRKEVKHFGAEEKKVQVLKQELQETPKSQRTESVSEHEPKTVTTEKEGRMESIVQFETVKESKDVTTTVKTIRFEVEVSSSESPEGETLTEVKDEIPEILKTTGESVKGVKHPGAEENAQVLKKEIQETPKSQETEPVNKGGTSVTEHEAKPVTKEEEPRIESIVQFETVKERQDVTATVKTIRFEVEVSSTESPECETLPEVKDETSADIHSEKAAVKTRVDVKEILTAGQQDAAQSDSTQPSSAASTAVMPLEEKTESVEISFSQQDKVEPGQTCILEHEPKTVPTEKEPSVHFETVKERQDVRTTDKTIRFEVEVSSTESPESEKLPEVKDEIPEILTATEERPKEVKDPSVEERKVQELKREMQETPKSQQTESVNKGEINVTEHETKPVAKEKEPRIESIVQFETVKERQDVTATVKTIRFEVEVSSSESPEGETLTEVKDEIPEILKTTGESVKDVKHPGAEENAQLLKKEIQETPKSQERESVNKGEINVTEHEHKTVPTEKGSIVQFETVKESKDWTTTGKTIRFEVEVSSTESPECEKLPEVKDEIPEILTTTEESPKEVKDPSVEERKIQELKKEMQESPKSQETESVNKGEINVTQHEPKLVAKDKAPRIESIVQFDTIKERQAVTTTVKTIRFEVEVSSTESPECETLPEVKDETSADIHSEKAAVKTRVDVKEILTAGQQVAAQSDSTQPSSAASTAVMPLEEKTESVEISFSQQDKVRTRSNLYSGT